MACAITLERSHSVASSFSSPSSVSSLCSSPPHEDFHSSPPLYIPRRKNPSRYESFQAICDSVPHRFRLKLYQDEVESYRSLVDSHDAVRRIRSNEMYQLLGMFAVFQGVIFSAVSQSTVLSCDDLWSPISLSFTACVATVLAVIQKRANIGDLKEKVRVSKNRLEAVYGKIEEMKLKGMDFDFNKDPDRGLRADKEGLRYAFSTNGIALLIVLLIFSIGVMISCEKVLCRECKCSKP